MMMRHTGPKDKDDIDRIRDITIWIETATLPQKVNIRILIDMWTIQ